MTPEGSRTTQKAGRLLTLSELSGRSGVAGTTLDYWSRLGLLVVAVRERNTRLYDAGPTLDRIAFIQRERAKGLNLEAIRRKLAGE